MNSYGSNVMQVLDKLAELYPRAGTRLRFNSIYELLVAVMLSAQSTDDQVNRVTARLFSRYNRPEEFAGLNPSELEGLIKGCGLYRNKAANIIKTARVLVDNYGGRVPETLDELLKLPGVGRKTANVVLSVGYGRPGLGVDTHVQRVAGRLGWHHARTPSAVEKALKEVIPSSKWSLAHHLLISHGREICKASRPRCGECGISEYCRYFSEEGVGRVLSGEGLVERT